MKGLPEALERQFEYEDPVVRGGKQLLHSPFFKVTWAWRERWESWRLSCRYHLSGLRRWVGLAEVECEHFPEMTVT